MDYISTTNIFISIKFLSAFIFGLFILDIKKLIEKKGSSVAIKYFSIFTLICFFLALSKYKNIGTDYSAHLIYISLIIFYFMNYNFNKKFFESKEFFIILCLILSLLVILKISMILCSLILIHYIFIIYQKQKILSLFSIYLLIPFSLVLIWFFQNYILSKCIIYPLSPFCFLDENSIKSVIFEHQMINLFAKSVKINYWSEPISILQEMNSISYWFPFWLNDHFLKICEKFVPSIILLNIFLFKLFIRNQKDIQLIDHQKLFFLISFVILIIWFLQTPAMRFGFSYLILNFFILNIIILKIFNLGLKDHLEVNYFSRMFNFIIYLMIIYQFIRIYSN